MGTRTIRPLAMPAGVGSASSELRWSLPQAEFDHEPVDRLREGGEG